MADRLTWADIMEVRRSRWSAVLVHITDRCPVGCAHCSVDSRPDSPTVTDQGLFAELVAGICAVPGFELVGVTGGEPFTARRALRLLADEVTAAGKRLVLYTSGVWAPGDAAARAVLNRTSCVVLGTDGYHAGRVPPDRFVAAARAVAAAGAWLVCQVVDEPAGRDRAAALLTRAFGPAWSEHAELTVVPLLPFGRGRLLRGPVPTAAGASFGRCPIVDAPTVRYDGWVLGCCNENVVTGGGPAALRRRVTDRAGLVAALESLRGDPLLTAFGRVGLGPLTALPAFRDLAERPVAGICDLCRQLLDRDLDRADPYLRAVSVLGTCADVGPSGPA